MRELHVHEAPDPEREWQKRVEIFQDLVLEGAPLPDDFREMLDSEYQHLAAAPIRRADNVLVWQNYRAWMGDVVEDPRTPRERLDQYFAETEAQLLA